MWTSNLLLPTHWLISTGDDRIRRYNNRIFELHRAASSVVDEDWDPSNPSLQSACEASPSHCGDEYSFVAASANDLDSSVYRISKQNAEAAHKIAEACVEINQCDGCTRQFHAIEQASRR